MKKCIGFIAMSGIRARDAELLELGLTLPGFVERSKVIASLPSLSMLTLAALTPADRFDVEYHEILDLKSAGPLPATSTSSRSPPCPRRSWRPTPWPTTSEKWASRW